MGKYEFLINKDLSPEKGLSWRAASIKRFEYSSLGCELEQQAIIAKKQNQRFDNVVKELTNKDGKESTIETYYRSNLI